MEGNEKLAFLEVHLQQKTIFTYYLKQIIMFELPATTNFDNVPLVHARFLSPILEMSKRYHHSIISSDIQIRDKFEEECPLVSSLINFRISDFGHLPKHS